MTRRERRRKRSAAPPDPSGHSPVGPVEAGSACQDHRAASEPGPNPSFTSTNCTFGPHESIPGTLGRPRQTFPEGLQSETFVFWPDAILPQRLNVSVQPLRASEPSETCVIGSVSEAPAQLSS